MKIEQELQPSIFAAPKEFKIDPSYDYTFGLNGTGTWQFWNGAAWKDYTESTGTSQGFIARSLGTGLIRLNTSATVTASFAKFLPENRTRKGNRF